MKKYIVTTILTVVLSAPMALAVTTPEGPPEVDVDVVNVMNRVVNWVFAFFLVMAVLFIIIAAFQFLTAGGDSSKVGAARDKLLYAAVGIMVAMLSRAIIPMIKTILNLD
jgi:hypothetical protein